jgi:class 3 adenylate cyclase
MHQIADWLKELGMSEYAERFVENHIDESIIRDLTDQDLKDLGVGSLGHRRKLLRAIQELGETPTTLTATKSEAVAATVRIPLDAAERRQLTVMFCDLVRSTARSARLDPEDLGEVIGAYHRCCTEQIVKSGGFVARYLGDGVLAYFGYPRAHEHDAERAVRTGLALVEAVPKLEATVGFPLQVRVGIATGLVVVGDLIGAGGAQEQTVVGETTIFCAPHPLKSSINRGFLRLHRRRPTVEKYPLRPLCDRDNFRSLCTRRSNQREPRDAVDGSCMGVRGMLINPPFGHLADMALQQAPPQALGRGTGR